MSFKPLDFSNIYMRPQKSQSPVGAIVLEPIWLRGGSETVLVPENEPHLDQPAGPPTLNASQHHQSSSHSKQIAAIPYSRQIGQFRQTQLNFGASSVANMQTWKSKNFSSHTYHLFLTNNSTSYKFGNFVSFLPFLAGL